ncbi:integrin alpha-PS2 isoform X2 [Microplitis mediator]|uniref:integrin alpha-PS2 isoform X2 n=1 Tax=Microplitis mediator TaxID=375433 RepID=UPI0025545BAA|nr:integrin alpha-PS2 isoform X2 [Microplitis mediator]
MREILCFRGIFISIILVSYSLLIWNTNAFNIETRHYTTYQKESKSMFGFSVAEYRDHSKRGWVIVGAPEAQTSQPNVFRGGAVYRCDIAVDDSCIPVEFDRKENNYIKNPNPPYNLIQIDNKTLQWFGATVSTSLEDGGPILACAPRYVFFSVSQSKKDFGDSSRQSIVGNRRDPVGTCWSTNFTTSTEFAPCRTRNFGYHRQGYCQAGLGAAVSRDGERIFIGAPGSWYWQGQTYTQLLNNRDKVKFTKEGSPEEDDSYLGYSVTTGDFIGNGDSGSAVGMPRGFGLHGKVILLTSNMTNHQNITGEQMGGYFGYALASGDIDGDGLDDLLVGAPMYTIPENPEMNYETGRIYIFYGKGPDKYRQYVTKDGESNRGRFGLSIASLGDIDRDGYGDFAVGAPYGGPEGRGSVYIYHGSRDGVQETYSQVIHAQELSSRVETFGFSVAGGLDLDGNLYPDMVVGSYDSSTAMFFRSRPVIKMVPQDTFVEFGSSSKLISLDDKDCTLSNTTPVTCLPLKACFMYTGDGVLSSYDFNVQYVLDVKKTKSPRLFFLEHEGKHTLNHTITVDRNQQFCRTVKVYVTPSIRDKLTSLEAEMRMSLAEERWTDPRPRDPRIPLRPVLATTSSRKDTLSIRKNCGADNICTPDLQLTVTPNVNRYLLGSGNRLEFDVLVKNSNEDAFEATYNLMLPPGVDYIKIERIDKAEIPVQCSAPKQSNNNTLKCDIGNPLPKGNLVHFNVLLQPVDVHDEKSSYDFRMNVNSTNAEPLETTADNSQHLSLEIWVETELLIEGESKPKDVYYNPDNYTVINATTDVEYGPAFIHNYTIRNQGPSRIEEAEVFLIWPAATLGKDDLVYLLEQPETTGPLVCATANSNPLSLKLEQRRRQYMHYSNTGVVHEHLIGSGKTMNVHTGYEMPTEQTNKHWRTSSSSSSSSGSSVSTGGSSVSTGGSSVSAGGSSVSTGSGSSVSAGSEFSVSRGSGSSSSSGSGSGYGTSNEKRVIIHTETGGSSLGIGDAMGTIHTTKEPLLPDLHDDKIWQTGRNFYDKNETHSIYHSANGDSVIDDSYKQTGGSNTNIKVTQTWSESRDEEEKRRFDDEEARRFAEQETRRLVEEERRRLEKIQEQRAQNNYNSREFIYGNEKKYQDAEVGKPGFGVRLRNITSTQDLEKFLGTLQDSVGYEVYHREGKRFLQFLGRYRVSEDGKEYVEFKDGSIFPLKNRFGEQSYGSQNTDNEKRYTQLEGQIIKGEDGKAYCRLDDDRRFPLQSTWYEERTYSSGSNLNGQGTGINHGGVVERHESTFTRVNNNNGGEFVEGSIKTHGNSWRETTNRHYGKKIETYETRVESKMAENQNEERGNDDNDQEEYYDDEEDNYEDDSRFTRSLDFVNKKTSRKSRVKKEFEGYEEVNGPEEMKEEKILPLCEAARCVRLRCTLGRLEKDEEVSISARYRVKGTTLKKIAADEAVKISTQLVARVTKLPFIGKPAGEVVKSHEVYTNVEPTARAPEPDVVPLWVVVLSACAGTIILLLLIFLLHKCGFFKRNRPSDVPERQPLNRNGHFQHGDDHL